MFLKRIIYIVTLLFVLSAAYAQVPYMKKLSVPELLPTQVVYDMHADSKGYIWFGTNKGLYRFNGKGFVSIPFDKTQSKEIAYLQEDEKGVIWCMNFFNQFFYLQKDTLRRFKLEEGLIRESSTLVNMVVDSKYVWVHSYNTIYQFDKFSHKLVFTFNITYVAQQITSSIRLNDGLFAYEPGGRFFSSKTKNEGWHTNAPSFTYVRLIPYKKGLILFGRLGDRCKAVEIKDGEYRNLPDPDLPKDRYLFQGIRTGNDEYWICTQKGPYRWDPETGKTTCYFPEVHVSDIAKDYQGNYWFSTLDNGVFQCPSLSNPLLKIYNNPAQDNFNRLATAPNGDVILGNNLGLIATLNLKTGNIFKYDIQPSVREMDFLSYDSTKNALISDRGVFDFKTAKPLDILHYGKGCVRDKFGNLLIITFNMAVLLNDDFKSSDRPPVIDCPLYQSMEKDTMRYFGHNGVILIRSKRGVSLLPDRNKTCFWIGYDDNLYEYHYDGLTRLLKDANGEPVVARSLQQQLDGSLVVGSSTKGVMVFKDGKLLKTYSDKNGLSSNFVRKVLNQNKFIWVLTESGLDRIDATTGAITNYFEEYGLGNTIVNDFIIQGENIVLATPTGILKRVNLPEYVDFKIRFPLLKAKSNGKDIGNDSTLPDYGRDITFYFEALHYLSPTAMAYQYRLIGLDTIWRTVNSFSNQLSFNRLNPGHYLFEIRALAGNNYRSDLRQLAFTVPTPYWQKTWFYLLILLALSTMIWIILFQWKNGLLRRQKIKEQLLKSQLVALRAQMNPHFLYNVLNTVQGLVYGNRKTEAGELLGNFSDLMRKTLHASDKQLLPLSEEIDNLRLYLELEKARFDEGFSFQIEVTNIDDMSVIYIPSLMLQPFAENSVKHGLMHKTGDKNLLIHFEKMPDGLRVIIDDNGIGRARSMEINQRTTGKPFSFATAALTERIGLFNNLYRQKITWAIIDKTDESQQASGTRIELFIPDYDSDPNAS